MEIHLNWKKRLLYVVVGCLVRSHFVMAPMKKLILKVLLVQMILWLKFNAVKVLNCLAKVFTIQVKGGRLLCQRSPVIVMFYDFSPSIFLISQKHRSLKTKYMRATCRRSLLQDPFQSISQSQTMK